MNNRRNKRQIETDVEPTIEREPIESDIETSTPKMTRDAFDTLEPLGLDKSSPKIESLLDTLAPDAPAGVYPEVDIDVASLQECTISKLADDEGGADASLESPLDKSSTKGLDIGNANDPGGYLIITMEDVIDSNVVAETAIEAIEPPADDFSMNFTEAEVLDVPDVDLLDDAGIG